MAASPTPGRTSTQDTYERLRADLLSCRLRPGARLSINDLCQKYAVSLGAVREALSRLTSEGLIIAEPHRGFRVAPISALELQQLSDAMIEIETICIRRAFATGDIAWEARVLAANHHLSHTPLSGDDVDASGDPREVRRCRFQDELVSACDNPPLLRLRATLLDQSARYRALDKRPRNDKDFEEDYQGLLDAALARDVEKAMRVVAAHRRRTTSLLMEALAELTVEVPEALRKRKSRRVAPAAAPPRAPVRAGRSHAAG